LQSFLLINSLALFGLLLFLISLRSAPAETGQSHQITTSTGLGWMQLALILPAAILAISRPGSYAACVSAIYGFLGSSIVTCLALITLIWWLARVPRQPGTNLKARAVAFFALRLASHVALTVGVFWISLFCSA